MSNFGRETIYDIQESTLFCIMDETLLYNADGYEVYDRELSLESATTIVTMIGHVDIDEGIKTALDIMRKNRMAADGICLMPAMFANKTPLLRERYSVLLYDDALFRSLDRKRFVKAIAKLASGTSNLLRIDKAELRSTLVSNVVFRAGIIEKTSPMHITAVTACGKNQFDIVTDLLKQSVDFGKIQNGLLYIFVDMQTSLEAMSDFAMGIQSALDERAYITFGAEFDFGLDDAQEVYCLFAYGFGTNEASVV